MKKGKQKSPGRATRRNRSKPTTPGGREKVTQINVYIAYKQETEKPDLDPQTRACSIKPGQYISSVLSV